MTIGYAQVARATARAMRPIGPAPQIKTGSPIQGGLRWKACKTTPRGSNKAPSVKVRFAGNLCRNFAAWTWYRRIEPWKGGAPEKCTSTQVVASVFAQRAGATRNSRLNSNAVTLGQSAYVAANAYYRPSTFMPEDIVVLHNALAN
ncbi:hypothetical protein LTR60_005071 [Cryomyces antarcticus]|nr:hypothetical protein LTR60_005071 [Cryomyces antarcticus]